PTLCRSTRTPSRDTRCPRVWSRPPATTDTSATSFPLAAVSRPCLILAHTARHVKSRCRVVVDGQGVSPQWAANRYGRRCLRDVFPLIALGGTLLPPWGPSSSGCRPSPTHSATAGTSQCRIAADRLSEWHV